MSDPNMTEFYRRASRVEHDRARGLGFEAPGVLGRSFYRRSAQKRSVFWPAIFVVLAAFSLKGAILYWTGPDLYNSRVAELRQASSVVDQAGGWIMQADPVSTWLAEKIAIGVAKAKT